MSLKASWLLDKRIAYIDTYGEVTPADLQATTEAVLAYISAGEAPVHVVIDHTRVEKFPAQLNNFKQFVARQPHPNTGLVILVSPNKLATFIISVVTQLSKTRMHTFSRLDDGLAFLGQYDKTLPKQLASSSNAP